MNTGNNLVYILTSSLLSYLLLSGIFGRRNIFCIDAELVLPEEVFAKTEVTAQIRVRNKGKWLPAFLVTVEACGGECFFPFVPADSTQSASLAFSFDHRGTAKIDHAVISSNFPFNFFRRFRRIRKEIPVIVYPKPIRCSLAALHESGARLKGEKELNKPGYDADMLSIRDYVHGDPPKYISWKATAKTGSLKVKELSAIERRHVIIDFDKMEKGNLETALSCTAYAVINLFRSRIPVGLRINGEILEPDLSASQRRAILQRLALYEPSAPVNGKAFHGQG